jgi:hypothetical protein
MFVPFDEEDGPYIPSDADYRASLRFEQDMAYKKSEEMDKMKAISKAEANEKKAKAEKERQEYEAALQEEKLSIEQLRAKRLLALQRSSVAAPLR